MAVVRKEREHRVTSTRDYKDTLTGKNIREVNMIYIPNYTLYNTLTPAMKASKNLRGILDVCSEIRLITLIKSTIKAPYV